MTYRFKKRINSLDIDIELISKINILNGDSAEGKSYLLELMFKELKAKGKSVVYLNYNNIDSNIKRILLCYENIELLLIDNGDLLLNRELLKYISALNTVVLVVLKDDLIFSGIKDVSYYDVIFNAESIKLKRGI